MGSANFVLGPQTGLLLADLDISVANVFARAGLSEALFARGTASLTIADYYALWAALEAEADDPTLVVRLAESISVESFDPPLFAAFSSPTLTIAAHRIEQFKPLIGPLRLTVIPSVSNLTIECQWPAGTTPPDLLIMVELMFWVALVRVATRSEIQPLRIAAPVHLSVDQATALEEFAGVRVEYAKLPTIAFSGRDAEHPFLSANDAMWNYFEPELRRRLRDVEVDAPVTELVRAAMLQSLPAGTATMPAVARQLAMSTRTLQRKLQLESSTFNGILRTTREALARNYLSTSALGAAEIAYLLGFDDATSFYRAFRTWTGQTPEAARVASVGAAD
jgi:AraC-like DNA-binding protein